MHVVEDMFFYSSFGSPFNKYSFFLPRVGRFPYFGVLSFFILISFGFS